jgi:hypothetical protein
MGSVLQFNAYFNFFYPFFTHVNTTTPISPAWLSEGTSLRTGFIPKNIFKNNAPFVTLAREGEEEDAL